MSKINLQTLGFSAKFAEEAASFGCFPVGRVSAQYKDLYRVITETGEVLAEVSGKLPLVIFYSIFFPYKIGFALQSY